MYAKEKKAHVDKFQEFKQVQYPQIELPIKHNTYQMSTSFH